jgi:hypothetical protein
VRSRETLWSPRQTKKIVKRQLVQRSRTSDGVTKQVTIEDRTVYCKECSKIKGHSISCIGPVDKVSNRANSTMGNVPVVCSSIKTYEGLSVFLWEFCGITGAQLSRRHRVVFKEEKEKLGLPGHGPRTSPAAKFGDTNACLPVVLTYWDLASKETRFLTELFARVLRFPFWVCARRCICSSASDGNAATSVVIRASKANGIGDTFILKCRWPKKESQKCKGSNGGT